MGLNKIADNSVGVIKGGREQSQNAYAQYEKFYQPESAIYIQWQIT